MLEWGQENVASVNGTSPGVAFVTIKLPIRTQALRNYDTYEIQHRNLAGGNWSSPFNVSTNATTVTLPQEFYEGSHEVRVRSFGRIVGNFSRGLAMAVASTYTSPWRFPVNGIGWCILFRCT